MPQNYAAAVVKALNQQDFHPSWCSAARPTASSWCPIRGGRRPSTASYMEQNTSLFLGEDKSAIPAVNTFLTWVQKASPGFKADLYTLFGWLSASCSPRH